MPLPSWLSWRRIGLVACVAFFVLAGRLAAGRYQDGLSAARADVSTAVAASQAAIASAGRAQQMAAAAIARADSLQRADSRARQLADSLRGASAGWRSRYKALAAAAPADCDSALAAADSLLAAGDSSLAVAQRRLADAQQAAAGYRLGFDTTLAALGRLKAAAGRVDSAALALSRRSRPSLLARLAPRPGVGFAAVVDPTGRPAVGFGVTFAWSR